MRFCFALIAGQATSFVLKQNEAKIQENNDASARRPAPGSPFFSGQRFFRGY
jgi:hypothetical protein